MKIKDMSLDNQPRERLKRTGPQSLSQAELLAIIIKTGTMRENVVEICHKLISKYTLDGLSTATLRELSKEHGIGPAKASQIISLFELYRRLPKNNPSKKKVQTSKDLANIYLPKFRDTKKEHFLAIFLDTQKNIIKDKIITIGILNSSLIHPREVFQPAIKNLAHSVIVIHNHPSGNPNPSPEDLKITTFLQKTGEIVGIPLLDHLILGHSSWWSWSEGKVRKL